MGGVRWKAANASSPTANDPVPARMCVSAAASLGIGVFVIVGYVAKHVAGPATLVSIAIAACVGLISALCNIELSQRLPRKASPYTFSHVSLGRFASFLTGWSLVLEYAVALAIAAKAIGLYVDALADDRMQQAFALVAPLPGGRGLGTHFDFFASVVVLLVGAVFLMDVQRRKWVDTGALVVAISAVVFIITAGSFNANPANWSPGVPAVGDDDDGRGSATGFFPFGVMDTFRGAALCTFAFIGIEMLMRSRRDTQRSVSYIGVLSFSVICLSMLGCAAVLTLMLPHNLMHVNVPFPHAFAAYDFNLAKWIVSIAAIVILSTSLWTIMFPLQRQIRTLAEEALLPFDERNRRSILVPQTIVIVLASLCAGLFSFGQLIDVLSVGTLLMFVVVSLSIVLLRYSHQLEIGLISTIDVRSPSSAVQRDNGGIRVWLHQMLGRPRETRPTARSYAVVKAAVAVQLASMSATAMTVRFAEQHIDALDAWAIALLVCFSTIALLAICVVWLQPHRVNRNYFQMPCVAATAGLTLFACLLLAGMLDYSAWARFAIWLCVGVPLFVWSRHRRRHREWPTTGISKLQGLHNGGFVGDRPTTNKLPEALAVQLERQMIEITAGDEDSDAYVRPSPVDNSDTNNNADKPAFDEIVRAADIESSLAEHRIPNGQTYFVDETTNAIGTAVADRPTPDSGNPSMVSAVIHSSSDLLDEATGQAALEMSAASVAALESDAEFIPDERTEPMPAIVSALGDDDEQRNTAFARHSDELTGESPAIVTDPTGDTIKVQTDAKRAPSPDEPAATLRRTAESASNATMHATAPGDFRQRLSLLLLGQTTLLARQTSSSADGAGRSHADGDSGDIRPRSSRDTTRRFTVTDVVAEQPSDDDDAVGIPKPPPFVADVYNRSTSESAAYIPAPDYDDDDMESPDIKASIRSKLENIFSRGPPQRVSSMSVDRLAVPDVTIGRPTNDADVGQPTTSDINYTESGQKSHANTNDDDHDAQRASDSITPESHNHRSTIRHVVPLAIDSSPTAAVSRTSTGAVPRRTRSATIQEALNSLRHVGGDLHRDD